MLCNISASKHDDSVYMAAQHSQQSFKPSQPSKYININNIKMSVKRSHTGEPVGEANYKFELEHNDNSILYAVVSTFNNVPYVHLRKYYNNLPTKFGVCMAPKYWWSFVNFLQDADIGAQFATPDIQCRKTKNGSVNLSCAKKDMSLYVKKTAIDSLMLR